MNIDIVEGKPEEHKTEALIMGVFEEEPVDCKELDDAVDGSISRAIEKKHFSAKVGSTFHITTLGKLPAARIILVGLGKKNKCSLETFRKAAASAIKSARCLGVKEATLTLQDIHLDCCPIEKKAEAVTQGILLGSYRFLKYITQDLDKIKQVEIVHLLTSQKESVEKGKTKAEMVCAHVDYCRDIINHPPNLVNPEYLAEEARKVASTHKNVSVEVLTPTEMKEKKMGAILAVGGGSKNEPRMIKLEYKPADSKKTIALVGKGITFDSGGLDIKPARFMTNMKHDMSGAAAVLSTIKAAAGLKLSVHIIAIMACAENMPSATAYRPDDIITAMNGKTIEMINTDAEGRVVLSDALSWASSMKPDQIIDLATLTGACTVALGDKAAGLLTKNDELAHALESAGKETYERVWRLPFFEEYMKNMKSDIADVKNSTTDYGAGTINGAVFLSHFVDEDIPWAHLDIANVSFREKANGYLPLGATGFGVRLLVNYLEKVK